MYKKILFWGIFLATFGAEYYIAVAKQSPDRLGYQGYQELSEIQALFPSTKGGVERYLRESISRMELDIEAIVNLKPEGMTFDTTFRALDKVIECFKITLGSFTVLGMMSPDEQVRSAATKAISDINAFNIDTIELHQRLFDVLKVYVERHEKEKYELLPEEQYFIDKTMKAFRKRGLQLPTEQRERVKSIKKELADLEVAFGKNIDASHETVLVTRDELKGIKESFIEALDTTEDGRYILRTTLAHYYEILYCEVGDTRKRIYKAFNQRAYPENELVLKKIIALQDTLAQLLNYQSYAHYILEDEMAQSPEVVKAFLEDIKKRALPQAIKDVELFMKHVPEGIDVIDNKFHPWDEYFVKRQYSKSRPDYDSAEMDEYFPISYTLPALLKIYEEFFGLSFKKEENGHFWHDDVQAYKVYKDDVYRGMILLDLFRRPSKSSLLGFCQPIVPARKTRAGQILPSVSLVIANFSKGETGLLRFFQVKTFSHEFGHALHALLGATELASFSGFSGALDFAEMPSQMLEQWLFDPVILKRISSHYETHKPLPDELIAKKLQLKRFDVAGLLLYQSFVAMVSLRYYMPGCDKDVDAILKTLYEQFLPGSHFDSDNKYYASFIHLKDYGPRVYCYLWSEVFALDLFNTIKAHGLTNPEIGNRYIEQVLSKGGSKDPQGLLRNFLGREPSSAPFFADNGCTIQQEQELKQE